MSASYQQLLNKWGTLARNEYQTANVDFKAALDAYIQLLQF
ncbi:hypothetical protein [Nostoc sp. CCY 9925]